MTRPKLTKMEYHQLALAGARALLVEMETKKLAVLDTFPELHPAMDGLPKLKGMTGGQRQKQLGTASQERFAWASRQPQFRLKDLADQFGITQSAAHSSIKAWVAARMVRKVKRGLYTAQKLLKAA